MKNKKRILSFFLSGVIIATSFVSCNNGSENGKKAISNNTTNNEVEVTDENFNVPEGIADGKDFKMYIAFASCFPSYKAEEENGNELNDAVFLRNSLVSEYTGANVEFAYSSRTTSGDDQKAETNHIRTLIQSGDDTYDAYVHVQHSGMPTLINEGMFVDWNTVPYVNIENPWWYSNAIRDITFGDKIYCMTGDYNLTSFSLSECIIFNKTLCDELQLEYPYQMVFDGTWTHDRFLQYIKAATKDLNGDGGFTREDDRFGFAGWNPEVIPALFCGYGGVILGKDENNLPVLNVDNERTYTVIDKMLEVFGDDGAFFVLDKHGTEDKMFNEGRLLFNDSFLSNVPSTRGLENIDVGFIPYPKLEEEQKEYFSRTANISCLTYIPVTNNDLETTGAVLEAMAFFSSDTIMPTYFDRILTVKSTRDIQSEEMIPIIRNSSRFLDSVIGVNYSGIIKSNNGNTLASLVQANNDAWQLKVEELIEVYSD